jgi:hypothetical protein
VNQFELEAWHQDPISPIIFLGECVKLVERAGYNYFTVDEWIDEEHREYAFIYGFGPEARSSCMKPSLLLL